MDGERGKEGAWEGQVKVYQHLIVSGKGGKRMFWINYGGGGYLMLSRKGKEKKGDEGKKSQKGKQGGPKRSTGKWRGGKYPRILNGSKGGSSLETEKRE